VGRIGIVDFDTVSLSNLQRQIAPLFPQVTGMVIDHVASQARFSGPQLIFSQISGSTPGGGSVAGNGTVTFSGGRTALNLSFNATQALLLNRDDVAARVTGPVQIRSNGQGGTISGDLKLNKGRFQLGRASSAAAVPRLNVREVGLDAEDVIEPAQIHPWKLDLKIAGNDLQVVGLGINSHWTTSLQVGGFADAPRFTGRADLVRGDYDFAGRNFRLDRGAIRFRGESPTDPQLDIRAVLTVQRRREVGRSPKTAPSRARPPDRRACDWRRLARSAGQAGPRRTGARPVGDGTYPWSLRPS